MRTYQLPLSTSDVVQPTAPDHAPSDAPRPLLPGIVRKGPRSARHQRVGVSTVSVCMGIRAPVIRVPSPSRLVLEKWVYGTVYGTVAPRIRPSSDGRIRPYDGRIPCPFSPAPFPASRLDAGPLLMTNSTPPQSCVWRSRCHRAARHRRPFPQSQGSTLEAAESASRPISSGQLTRVPEDVDQLWLPGVAENAAMEELRGSRLLTRARRNVASHGHRTSPGQLEGTAGVEPVGKVETTMPAKRDALVLWCKAWPGEGVGRARVEACEERGGSGHCCLRGWRCNGRDTGTCGEQGGESGEGGEGSGDKVSIAHCEVRVRPAGEVPYDYRRDLPLHPSAGHLSFKGITRRIQMVWWLILCFAYMSEQVGSVGSTSRRCKLVPFFAGSDTALQRLPLFYRHHPWIHLNYATFPHNIW